MGVGFFGKIFSKGNKVSPTIRSVKPNVPKTPVEKAKSKLAIAKQKTKASKARLDNTVFRIEQQKERLKEAAKDKRNEEIVKKFIGEKKAKGGRVGLKAGTNPFKKKSNIDKIKETFGPKKRVNAKKGFPDLSGDGKTTFKDILIGRGVIKKKNGKKKKVI